MRKGLGQRVPPILPKFVRIGGFLDGASCEHDLVLRPDLILTQGLKLFEAEFGAASRSDFGGAHAGQIVGRA